jgi:hypothetical protein
MNVSQEVSSQKFSRHSCLSNQGKCPDITILTILRDLLYQRQVSRGNLPVFENRQEHKFVYVRFEVPSEVSMKIVVFRYPTPWVWQKLTYVSEVPEAEGHKLLRNVGTILFPAAPHVWPVRVSTKNCLPN